MAQHPYDIWPLLARPGGAPLPRDTDALRDAAARFAGLISPALAEHLLAPVSARLGAALLDPDAVARDRLLKTFTLAQHRSWARCLVDTGIDVVFLKGFANAHTLYGDPRVRAQGDLDILVHGADLSRAVDFLSSRGFRFRASPLNPWGMISDASFMPMVSPDGACPVDIHIHPDCYPAHLSLTTGLVFARAATVEADGFRFRAPCADHALVLCATNAAKDKFFLSSVTKAIDAILLLRDRASAIDWDGLAALARDGAFFRPMATFLALLAALGAATDDAPGALRTPPRGLRGLAFRGVVDDYRALFPDEVPLTTYLCREWLLGAEPRVALRNLLVRTKGLFRPSSGIPECGPVGAGNVLLPLRSDAGIHAPASTMARDRRTLVKE